MAVPKGRSGAPIKVRVLQVSPEIVGGPVTSSPEDERISQRVDQPDTIPTLMVPLFLACTVGKGVPTPRTTGGSKYVPQIPFQL